MKLRTALTALCCIALACDSSTGNEPEGGFGSVALADSSDTSGKADALMGRQVQSHLTEIVSYSNDTKRGISTVTSFDNDVMVVESPLVALNDFEDALQVSIDSPNENTQMRFFLAYGDGTDADWRIVVVEGNGEFEDGDEVEGDADATPVAISYFQSVSILKSENTISVTSDAAAGQTTTTLPFDAASTRLAVLALPVDSGAGNTLVDAFDYVIEANCDGTECGVMPVDPEPVDDYAQARDVDLEEVTIGGGAIDYSAARVDTGFGLGGTEFWQKWSGGLNPTYSYTAGSEAGRKCMLASAIRFEAIMSNPPESLVKLKDESNWSGRFFNWNDDFSESPGSDARGSVLWAWKTGLIKWISQTGRDGTCYLPTVATVEAAAANCLATGERDDGEIEGCQGRG